MTAESHFGEPPLIRTWGFWAILSGVIAVVMVFTQMQILSMQESATVGQQIGEIAGEIKRAAWRSFFGLAAPEPEPAPLSMRLFNVMFIAAPAFAGGAIVLSAVSFLKREYHKLGICGTALGVGAILLQYVWWIVLVMLGFVLLIKIVENIGDIFSFGG